MIFLTSKSVYKHQNNESGEINVQISEKRNEKHQKHNSFQNGDKMADTCVNKLVSSPLWVVCMKAHAC